MWRTAALQQHMYATCDTDVETVWAHIVCFMGCLQFSRCDLPFKYGEIFQMLHKLLQIL